MCKGKSTSHPLLCFDAVELWPPQMDVWGSTGFFKQEQKGYLWSENYLSVVSGSHRGDNERPRPLLGVHAGFFIHHLIIYFIVALLTCVSLPPHDHVKGRGVSSSKARPAIRGRLPWVSGPPCAPGRSEPCVHAADRTEHAAHHLHEYVRQRPRLGAGLQPLGTRLAERAPAGPGRHRQLRVPGQHQHAVQPRYLPARPWGTPPPAPGTPSQAQHGPWGPAEGVQAVHRVLGLPKWRGTLGSGFVVGLSAVPRGSFRRHPCQGVESGSQGMGAV